MMAVTPEVYDTIVHVVDQRVGEIKVTREAFDKLAGTVSELSVAVRELAEAQKRTEERLGRVEGAVERLAEAQKRTDERLQELAGAQKRTDERLQELAGAQKRTDERLQELAGTVRDLAEAQKRTDERLQELADAQKRTEVALRELAEAQKRTNEAVGRLTDTIGHDLESVARVSAPNWLQVYEDVKVPGLERRIFKVDGEDVEINLYGEGVKGRAPVTVVGEAKSTIHGRDVEAFSGRVNRLKSQLRGRIIKLMFGYWIHPSAEQEAKKLQVHVIAPPGTYPTPKPTKRKQL